MYNLKQQEETQQNHLEANTNKGNTSAHYSYDSTWNENRLFHLAVHVSLRLPSMCRWFAVFLALIALWTLT